MRIDAGHYVLDATVLSAGIHGLKDDEQSVPVGGIEQLLQGTEVGDVLFEELLVFALGLIHRLDQSPLEINGFPRMNAEFLNEFFHSLVRSLKLGDRVHVRILGLCSRQKMAVPAGFEPATL